MTGFGLFWLSTLRRYLLWSAGLHFVWEIAQLPLYTLWRTGTWREIVSAILHCTAGDIMITTLSLVAALVAAGSAEWPRQGAGRVTLVLLFFGIAYTIYSEWLNTVVRRNWEYTSAMPRLPGMGTGLSPLLQWLIVPLAAMHLARCEVSKRQP